MKPYIFILFFFLQTVWAGAVELRSPDGRYCITFKGMHYSVTYQDKVIVRESRWGIDIDNRLFESALGVPRGNHEDWCGDLVLQGEERTEHDTIWTPLYGENARIRDCYRQLVLHYEKGRRDEGAMQEGYDKRMFYAMDIVIRAYNEGIAFRYHFPETSNGLFLHIKDEHTTFVMPEGTVAWYEEWAQGPFYKVPLKEDFSAGATTPAFADREHTGKWFESERPLLMQLPDGCYVALLEAAMKDYTRGKFRLVADNVLKVGMYGGADIISPYDTPWRVIMAGTRAVDLINHKDLLLNLNEPCTFSHTEFIKPGKAFRSGRLDKAHIIRSIDYCKAFGMDYVELDAGWYGPEGKVESDARKVSDTRDFTMEEICRYAREKGIGVWVYVNQRALYRQLDELLPLYKQWGIRGIKFGFVQVGNQYWSTWLHEAVAKCAGYGLMVDIHDEYRPTGLSRTYPNLLTQEGIGGNEEMPDATHNVILPFTRFLCGPADYTLCYFNSRVKNTHGHQLAMAAVYYSPLQFLFWYDVPFPNGWEAAELQFWRDIPTVFDESVALDGAPGEYIVQARRCGDDWFVGVMTNTEGRAVTVSTDFLSKGRYEVIVYNDDPALATPTKVAVTHRKIKAGTPVELVLQPCGGAALHIRRIGK